MHCSNCGAHIDPNARHCSGCGAPVAVSTTGISLSELSGLRECPRCGYRGEAIGYFGRPGHMGLLVGLSLLTYFIGGLIYWLARRQHKVCPNCGYRWEMSRALGTGPGGALTGRVAPIDQNTGDLPRSGIFRRVLGGLLALFAAFMIVIGIVETAPEAVAVGAGFGFAGSASFWWGVSAMQSRRKALEKKMKRSILRLAEMRGGTLTVTEVAAYLDLSLPAAEDLLVSMEDGLRIRSNVTTEGLIVYEFPEVQHLKQLESGIS